MRLADEAPSMMRGMTIGLVALVAACGGDGGTAVTSVQAPSQGTSTAAAARIDGGNYLDAFAVGTVALSRVVDAAHIVGIWLDGRSYLDLPGARDCWADGALEWHDLGLSEYTSVEHPCLSGSVELRSGAFEFRGFDVGLTDVVWRQPPNATDQMVGGEVRIERKHGGSVSIGGWFSVQRNVRHANYVGVSLIVIPASAGSPPKVESGSLQVRSSPFAPGLLTIGVTEGGAKVTISAPDRSHVVVSDASSGTTSARTFEVFDAGGTSPIVELTLAADDPLVLAAMARALE